MKRISTRLTVASALLFSSAALGQQYPPTPQKDRLDDDPTFHRLSLEKQTWIRQMTDRLNTAIKQRDTKALDQLQLDAVTTQLIGRKFCDGKTFDQATYLDAVETGANTQAYAVRWLDPKRGDTFVHTAIFTDSRCIASDGDLVDGRRILRVLRKSLTVSAQHGLVAYEALYLDDSTFQGPARRGVFIENHFIVDIDQDKRYAGPPADEKLDFWWRADSEYLEVLLEIPAPSPDTEQK